MIELINMKKIKAFIYIFYNSLTSFSYYKDILNTSFSFSIKYLAVLAIVATIITTSVVSTKDLPKITQWVNDQKITLINLYPEDFEIKVENNKWNINKEQPYIVKTPESFKTPEATLPKNFIIFDQKGTINDFEARDTMILVNETNILSKSNGKFDVYPLKELPNGTLNKQRFTEIINQFDVFIKYIPAIFIVITTIFMFFYYFVFKLIYLLFVAIALVIANMFIKPSIEFKHLYRIALHAMTVPFILDMLIKISGVQDTSGVPWFLIINIVIGMLVMITATKIND
jgi:hypothetical protein